MPNDTIARRQRRRRRRDRWFWENGPCADCGTWEDLELDHVDPTLKVDHRVWTWGDELRLAELAKCVPRCRSCHRVKTNAEIRARREAREAELQVGLEAMLARLRFGPTP